MAVATTPIILSDAYYKQKGRFWVQKPVSISGFDIGPVVKYNKRVYSRKLQRQVPDYRIGEEISRRWAGWGCGLFSMFYSLKLFGIRTDPAVLEKVALQSGGRFKLSVEAEAIVKTLRIMGLKADVRFVSDLRQAAIYQRKNMVIIAEIFRAHSFYNKNPNVRDKISEGDGHFVVMHDVAYNKKRKHYEAMFADSDFRTISKPFGLYVLNDFEYQKIRFDFEYPMGYQNEKWESVIPENIWWHMGLIITVSK